MDVDFETHMLGNIHCLRRDFGIWYWINRVKPVLGYEKSMCKWDFLFLISQPAATYQCPTGKMGARRLSCIYFSINCLGKKGGCQRQKDSGSSWAYTGTLCFCAVFKETCPHVASSHSLSVYHLVFWLWWYLLLISLRCVVCVWYDIPVSWKCTIHLNCFPNHF